MSPDLIRATVALATFALSACQTMPPAAPSCTVGEPMVETQLFFGLARKGGDVTPGEWKEFLNRDVVPRFAEGFTVVDAQGFWLSGELKRTIAERSKVILRLHPEGHAQNKAIDEIVDVYKKRFAQESVLRVDRAVCAQF